MIISLCGCGGVSDAPKLAPVSGKVLINGKPVKGLSVAFYPDTEKGTLGPLSIAETSEDGSFILISAGARQGAVIGDHKVVVSCPEFGNVEAVTGDGYGSAADGEAPAEETEVEPQFKSGCPVPEVFTTVGTTTQTVEIPEGGASDLLFDLK